jgi:transcriptional regulator with XRE-family HTH domain
MVKLKRRDIAAEAARRMRQDAARVGSALRVARRRRRLTQQEVAAAVGLGRSTVSAIENGRGGGHTLDTWQRLGLAVGRALRVELERDWFEPTGDAGHLGIQELVLRLGRGSGYAGTFELNTRPTDSSRSTDVALRDDRKRRLILVECWNTFADIGASVRSSTRKRAEAADFAVAIGGTRPYSVHACWVVRDTGRNRELIRRYPTVFSATFPGSSIGWVQALTTGAPPPDEPGLVWCDNGATRLIAWRRR